MIMAGRGKHLLDKKDNPKKFGNLQVPLEDVSADLPSLIKEINEIIIGDLNPSVFIKIEHIIKKLFTSNKIMKDTLSELHKKALCDPDFSEKMVIALEKLSNLEVDGSLLRNELFFLIQNDFEIKETTFKSDPKTFLNSVMLLGHIYNRFKVCGSPIVILGIALFEYFDLLIKGQEEELKTLTKQILLNGKNLKNDKKYELLMEKLRNTLISKELNSLSKCWILLTIDFMSNDLKPLNEVLRDFYVKTLGEQYKKLEVFIPIQDDEKIFSPLSPESPKSQSCTSPKNKNVNLNTSNTLGFKKDLSKNFSNMNIRIGHENKDKIQSLSGKNNRKDFWKTSGSGGGFSGHDDRFEKEENYYGTQKLKQSKPESQRKKFSDDKSS